MKVPEYSLGKAELENGNIIYLASHILGTTGIGDTPKSAVEDMIERLEAKGYGRK